MPREPPPAVAAFEATVSYAPELRDAAPTVVHGVRLGMAWGVSDELQIFAAYRFQFPFDEANDLVDLTLSPHPFELGLGGRWAWGPWGLGVAAALVNDVLSWSATAKDETVRLGSPTWRWVVSLAPEVAFSWSPRPFLGLFLAVGADIPLNDGPLVVSTPEGPVGVVDSWPARPWVRFGMDVRLF